MNKKFCVIALVIVAVVASSLYGAYELRPPTGVVSGQAQYGIFTYEEMVDRHPLIVVGEISNLGVKVFTEETIAEDDDGNEYVYERHKVPNAEIIIQILEVLKDEIGLDANTVVVYDRTNGIGETDNGQRVQYISRDVVEHKVGDKGIFFIANDRGLRIDGYASYYPIIDGKTTVTTELDKVLHKSDLEKPPIDLELAKQLAKADQ